MKGKDYDAQMEALQIELAKMQAGVKATGKRLVVVFEGRDAAGKGGTIKAVTREPEPAPGLCRGAAETDRAREASNGISSATSTGCPPRARSRFRPQLVQPRDDRACLRLLQTRGAGERFFRQLPEFEQMIVDEGIIADQDLAGGRPRRAVETLPRPRGDPLKQWKLSQIDIDGLAKWDDYCAAIDETMQKTHFKPRPGR
jgi:polyphosphate kinase 2 (PPK2 family)